MLAGYISMLPRRMGSTGCREKVNSVTIPRFPPLHAAPRTGQGSRQFEAVTTRPSAVTTSALSRLSQANPKLRCQPSAARDMRNQIPVNAVDAMEMVRQAADELRELADLISRMGDLDTPGPADRGLLRRRFPSSSLANGSGRSRRSRCTSVSDLDPITVSDVIAGLADRRPCAALRGLNPPICARAPAATGHHGLCQSHDISARSRTAPVTR